MLKPAKAGLFLELIVLKQRISHSNEQQELTKKVGTLCNTNTERENAIICKETVSFV